MNLEELIRASLRRQERLYKHIFYCPKKNEIYLCRSTYELYKGKKKLGIYVHYADKKLFGKHINIKKTDSWEGIGLL